MTEAKKKKPLQDKVEIVNKLGLHTRPAATFVKAAAQFKSDVKLSFKGQEVDGKSILGVLMLAAGKGSKVTLIVEGEDQDEAFIALKKVIASGFGEK